MKKIFTFFVFLLLSFGTSFGQKISSKTGTFKALNGEENVQVVFVYDKLKLMNDNLTETDYVTEKVRKMNEKQFESGDNWKKTWEVSKESFWEPKFLTLLNKYTSEVQKMNFGKSITNSKYIITVHVVWIYPGWDAAVMRQPAKLNTVVNLTERSKPEEVLATYTFLNAPGDQYGSNFNNETRIAESFAKTGKTLGKIMSKQLK